MRGKKAKALRRQVYGEGDFRKRELFGRDRSKVVSVFGKDGKEKVATVERYQAISDATRTAYQHAKKVC
jgi:hypothetical protein